MQQVMECTLICFSFLSEIHIEITLVTILAWVLREKISATQCDKIVLTKIMMTPFKPFISSIIC